MTNQTSSQNITTADGVSPSLRTWGTRSWFYLGIALWAFVIISFLSTISGLFVPLVVAVIMAMLFHPLVDRLATHRINRTIGSLLVILLVMAILISTAWVTWTGIYDQSDEILIQLESGLAALSDWSNLNLPAGLADQIRVKALEALPQVASGITAFFFSGFSSVIALFLGAFTALFLLFYLLADWRGLSGWVGRHLGLPEGLGLTLVADATSMMRTYFYAVTLSNLPVALGVGITMWLLGLPLAVPVALVTIVTAYIPFLGAIVSGIFAALVALGAGDLADALIIVAVILGLQNIAGPIINNRMASDKLEIHPIITLVTTLAGGILFGALGGFVANPVTAVLIDARKQIQVYHAQGQADGDQEPAVEARRVTA